MIVATAWEGEGTCWAWAQELRPCLEEGVLECTCNTLEGFAEFRKELEFNVMIVCTELLFDLIECFSFFHVFVPSL